MARAQVKCADEAVRAFMDRCRGTGVKVTHQRLEIFRELAGTRDHPSADQVYTRVRTRLPTISLDTIYRTLNLFEAHGVISKVAGFDNLARFDGDRTPHHHMVCVRCKKIADVHWPRFDEQPLPRAAHGWGRVEARHARLTGLCKDCLKRKRRAVPGR